MSEIDEEDDEDMILDRTKMIPQSNTLGLNQFNIGLYSDRKHTSKSKSIVVITTCLMIGILIGLIGGSIPCLLEHNSYVIWMITLKSVGFFLGILVSSYVFSKFNIYCLLGISSFMISCIVFFLPSIENKILFCIVSVLFGFNLAIIYNGIDVFYIFLYNQPLIRWFHVFITLGAIISTILLFPSVISVNIQTTTTIPHAIHPRAILNDSSTYLNSTELNETTVFPISTDADETTATIINETTEATTPTTTVTVPTTTESPTTVTTTKSSTTVTTTKSSTTVTTTKSSTTVTTTKSSTTVTTITTTTTTTTESSTTVTTTTIESSTTVTTTTTESSTTITTTTESPTIVTTTIDHLESTAYSKSYIQRVYKVVAVVFFILAIFYLKFAFYDEKINLPQMKSCYPLSFVFVRVSNTANHQFDHLPLRAIFSILGFYFILFGIQYSCSYLTTLLGKSMNLNETTSLLLQLSYFLGQLIDILIHYLWFSISNQINITTLSYTILIRIILLSCLSLLNIFQHYDHLLLFSISFLLTSVTSLFLYWIERSSSVNENLLRLIFFVSILSESIFPTIFFSLIQYLLQYYLLTALCLLIILFRLSKMWQDKPMYSLSPAIAATTDIDFENENDNL